MLMGCLDVVVSVDSLCCCACLRFSAILISGTSEDDEDGRLAIFGFCISCQSDSTKTYNINYLRVSHRRRLSSMTKFL